MENLPYFVRVLTLDISVGKAASQAGGAETGTLAAGAQTTSSDSSQSQGKIVKLDLLVIIYGSGAK
jgi:hypothetical protein